MWEAFVWICILGFIYVRSFLWFLSKGIWVGVVIESLLVVWIVVRLWVDGKINEAMGTWKGRSPAEVRAIWDKYWGEPFCIPEKPEQAGHLFYGDEKKYSVKKSLGLYTRRISRHFVIRDGVIYDYDWFGWSWDKETPRASKLSTEQFPYRNESG